MSGAGASASGAAVPRRRAIGTAIDGDCHFDNPRNMEANAVEPDADADTARLAAAFAALGSAQRLGVLRTLVRAGPEGLTIGALGDRCGIPGSTLSHHLGALARAGLIRQSRQGRAVLCAAAAYAEVEELSRYLLTECCADRPAATGDTRHD